VAEAGALAGALGTAVLILATSRIALGAGLALVGAAVALLAVDGGQLDSIGGVLDSVTGFAALAGALLALAVVAALLVRWPVAIVPALLAVAPIRPPLATDPESPLLLGFAGTGGLGRLYPLYGVLAASVLALAWRTVRGAAIQPIPRVLAVPAAVLVALVVGSFLWSEDQAAATRDLVFLWLPFTVLLVVAAQAPFTELSGRLLAILLVAIAAAMAGVALYQAALEELVFFTVSLEQANELGSLYRVTAAFQDPNHLGRHLVMAIGVVLVAAWSIRLSLEAALALLVLLMGGLLVTYSQSSFVTLAVLALGIALVAATGTAQRTLRRVAAALALVAVVAVGVLFGSGASDEVTSDRSSLVADTAAVAAAHPIVGVGVAAQPLVTRRDEAPEESKLQNVSHSTPLTVAAELGVVGLAAFVAMLVGAALVLMDVARRDRALALGIAAVLATLVVHSLFYAGFFENPISWLALGVTAAAAQPLAGGSGRAGFTGPPGRRGALRS
jgi:O-antigen ligase